MIVIVATALGMLGNRVATGHGLRVEPVSIRLFIPDHLGSIRALSSEQGVIIRRRSYSPYGDGELASHPSALRGFAGLIHDRWGFIEAGARTYDPRVGRFLSKDPLYLVGPSQLASSFRQVDLYGYAMSNPIRYTDPDGREVVLGKDESKARAVFQDLRLMLPGRERESISMRLHPEQKTYSLTVTGHRIKSDMGLALRDLIMSPHTLHVHPAGLAETLSLRVGNTVSPYTFDDVIGKIKHEPGNLDHVAITALDVSLRDTSGCRTHCVFSRDRENHIYYASDWENHLELSMQILSKLNLQAATNGWKYALQGHRATTLAHEVARAQRGLRGLPYFYGNPHADAEAKRLELEAWTNALVP